MMSLPRTIMACSCLFITVMSAQAQTVWYVDDDGRGAEVPMPVNMRS